MEVPASGDAVMWIYDGDKWLQHPSGKDGAPGADGNIADATEQGVIATWDNTAGQWTPDSSLTINSSGNATFGGVVIGERFKAVNNGTVRFDLEDASNPLGKKFIRSEQGEFQVVNHAYSRVVFRVDDGGNGQFMGSLLTDTGRVAGVKDLIETLATLRNATRDETTLEGLRDAIGNAVGGLIEKFEAMQSTATQEIESE